MIIPLLCYGVASLCAASLQLFAELLERKICLQLHAHLRGGTASNEGWQEKKRQSEPETESESDSVVWSPLLSLHVSLVSLSVCRTGLSTSSERITTVFCICICMCLYMCAYVCIQTIKWPYGQYKMKLILCTLHDIIFMDYLFMHVDINFIAFIEMYYYTLQHLRMCENKGVFFTEGLSKTILYRVQCNLVPACFLVFPFQCAHF